MVRHTKTAEDEANSTTRRTRADVRYLADVVTHTKIDVDAATDAERNSRLRSHGWVTSNATTTGDGHRVAGVAATLADDRLEEDDLEWAIDIMGMSNFVDACVEAPSIQDAVAYIRGVFVCANLVDEALNDADTYGVEYEHDGLFEPFFAPDGFDARKGTVEMRFRDESTARSWVGYVSRYDPEFKHDERFTGNRNPRRVVVDVLA